MSMLRGAPAGLDDTGRPVGRKPDTDLGPTLDTIDTSGSGPVEVRKATPEELSARKVTNPSSPWRSQNAASYAAYQRRLAETAPAPATGPETPYGVPCGNCAHHVVCRLRERVEGLSVELRRDLGDGITVVASGIRIECEHHVPVDAAPVPEIAPGARSKYVLTRDEAAIAAKRGSQATAAIVRARREKVAPPPAAPIRPRAGRHGMKATGDEIIAALRANSGDFTHASLQLGMTAEGVRLRARAMAERGELPADVVAMVPAKRKWTKPA